jgi:hypothetical protein
MNWTSILNIYCGRLSENNYYLVFETQVGYAITEFSPIYTPSRGRAGPLTLGVKTEIHSLLTPTRGLTSGDSGTRVLAQGKFCSGTFEVSGSA